MSFGTCNYQGCAPEFILNMIVSVSVEKCIDDVDMSIAACNDQGRAFLRVGQEGLKLYHDAHDMMACMNRWRRFVSIMNINIMGSKYQEGLELSQAAHDGLHVLIACIHRYLGYQHYWFCQVGL